MYYYYDNDGKILASSSNPLNIPNSSVIFLDETFDISMVYIEQEAIKYKEKLYPQDKLLLAKGESLVIPFIPENTILYFEDYDNPITINDGELEITFNKVDSWDIVLLPPFQYLNQVIRVTTYETII